MSTEIFDGPRNVVGYPEMPFQPLPHQEQQKEVLNLSPKQVQIFEFQSIGLTENQIVDKLGIKIGQVKREIKGGLSKSGQLSSIHVISRLLESGQINREKIAEGLDFEDYRRLTSREKEILDYVAKPSTWEDREYTLAKSLGMSESTFKGHLTRVSNKLELPTPKVLLRSRVFMLLLREKKKHMAQSLEKEGLIFDAFDFEIAIIKGDFSQQIKGYREKRGLTQRRLSLRAGINHSSISKLESPTKREPTASTVFALSRSLGLNPKQTIGLLESVYQEHKEKFSTVLTKQKNRQGII